ncbi:hypothetical protein Taro_019280 [Colocasia esculenta]|uniref:Uncharacterized protein n=1 Tax=Colocasia esculenta TaxID=4460 RepID=A0A843UYT6_COLES|nr:hypothetical protein [Colocasia esculenta]
MERRVAELLLAGLAGCLVSCWGTENCRGTVQINKKETYTLEAVVVDVDLAERLDLEATDGKWDSLASSVETRGVPGGVKSLCSNFTVGSRGN